MSESGSIVAETAARIFADLADPQEVNSAKDTAWKGRLWHALAESGLTLAWVPEANGGVGAELTDGFAILGVAGRYAAAVPLAETLLAGWLLSRAGLNAPNSAMSVALVETAGCRLSEGMSLASEPSNTVTFDRVKPIAIAAAPKGLDQTALMLMGCTVRSVETAGALQAILDMTVRYSNERVAFERPIAKFQAVQHSLARLAGEVSAAMTAAHSAGDAIARAGTFDDTIFLEATAAKIRSAEAAQEGAAIAHQVHGAIGFTIEHILHRYSLRALSWRDDFGHESWWAVELGKMVAARGADELWPLVASR